MNERRYTRGPWEYDQRYQQIKQLKKSGIREAVAYVYKTSIINKTNANANLIANAPEMFELLKKLEWAGMDAEGEYPICPYCHGDPEEDGHDSDCELANLFKKIEGDL